MNSRKSICFVVAVPGTAESFLKDHIRTLSENYDVYLVADFSGMEDFSLEGLKGTKNIRIRRNISPFADLAAVTALARYFRKMQFDAVHSVTPKAGLLTAIAGKWAGISNRVHIFTGQVWATRTGVMRKLLMRIDRLIAQIDTHILVDGEAQRQFLISNGILNESNSRVLGAGSICGVNTKRFTPSAQTRDAQRAALGIAPDRVVFCFLGRLNRDKGIYELLAAFNDLAADHKESYLLFFGRDEENCMGSIGKYSNIRPGENFCYYGPTPTPELSLQAADVFCLPSYREGFGMSVIEASCLGLPVICSDAYGLRDTMVNNKTGMRCKVSDVESLREAMRYLNSLPDERHRLGEAGRHRVLDLFTGETITGAWSAFYREILK